MKILGIRVGHDSCAALIIDGTIVADAAEERFTRIKNDSSFPVHAINFCLNHAGINSSELDVIAFPNTEYPEIASVFLEIPNHLIPQTKAGAVGKVKQAAKGMLGVGRSSLPILPLYHKPLPVADNCKIVLCPHHLAHAASAYYTSGLNDEKVLIATLDGIGDGISVALWRGSYNLIEPIVQYDGTGSLGWFYGNATEGLEWRHGSDEWKVMGLSPYGSPKPGTLKSFHPEYRDGKLVRPHEYGEFGRWNDHGANHYHGREASDLTKIAAALGREDYSAEVQRVVEEQAMEIILPWLRKENTRYLCSAGGFFLNVKFNQKLWYTGELSDQWIYPNPGDAGLAVGAALYTYFNGHPERRHERLTNLYFGPEFSNAEIKDILDNRGLDYEYVEDPSATAADFLTQNLVLGWFQGRMESGPRALGNRSILMSPTRAENKDIVNSKIKFREAFRPFCPSMLHERSGDYLEGARDEFFMVSSFLAKGGASAVIPAVVHVDGTARPQMVKKEINPRYYRLIEEFGRRTGVFAIMNTSFNVKGEPIVCSPREAIRCFYDTGIDVLVLGNFVLRKPAVKSGIQ